MLTDDDYPSDEQAEQAKRQSRLFAQVIDAWRVEDYARAATVFREIRELGPDAVETLTVRLLTMLDNAERQPFSMYCGRCQRRLVNGRFTTMPDGSRWHPQCAR